MAGFLTDDWVRELDEAAARIEVPEEVALTVRQVVVEDDGETILTWTVADGRVSVVAGAAAEADVTFEQDRATAAAIARGELSAQVAFITGRLRVGGDLRRVIDSGRDLSVLADVFEVVRRSTAW